MSNLLDGRACVLTSSVERIGSLITGITYLYEFGLRNCQDHDDAHTPEITLSQTFESQASIMKMVSVYGPCNPAFKAMQKEQPLCKDYIDPFCTLFLFYMLRTLCKSYQGIAGGV